MSRLHFSPALRRKALAAVAIQACLLAGAQAQHWGFGDEPQWDVPAAAPEQTPAPASASSSAQPATELATQPARALRWPVMLGGKPVQPPAPQAPAQLPEVLGFRQALERALIAESGYRAQQAEHAATREEIPRARAALLPNVSASGIRYDNNAYVTQTVARENDYISKNYTLTLRQPLLNQSRWVQYRQAQVRVDHSGKRLEAERQRLILQIAQAYLNCLHADAVAQFAQAEVTALEGMLASVKRGHEAGETTLTDIYDAEARLDDAKVKQIEAGNSLDAARRVLETALGHPVKAIQGIAQDSLTLAPFESQIAQWQQEAVEANAEVAAARLALSLAGKEVQLQRAGHLPTLDLIAQRQLSQSDTISTLGTRTRNTMWGVQLNVPLYSGGYVNASTRQAASRLTAAQAKLDAAAEQVRLHSSSAAEKVHASMDRIRALERAEHSAAASLNGTEKGLKAGTRSFIDILNARKQLFEVRLRRAQANTDFVLSLIDLMAVSGQLDGHNLQAIDGFFSPADVLELGAHRPAS